MLKSPPLSDSTRDDPSSGLHSAFPLERLSRHLRSQGFRDHDVEDALQEARLMAVIYTGHKAPSDPKAWLFTVARNAARKAAIRRREWNVEVLPELWIHPLTDLDEAEERQHLLGAIRAAAEQLPQLKREIIHQRYFVGQTIREVAGSLGLGEGVVRGHLKHALKTMKLLLLENN